jgi:hypothetical protein
VSLHSAEAPPDGFRVSLVVKPAGEHPSGDWERWRRLLHSHPQLLQEWDALVAQAGSCLRFLPPLAILPDGSTHFGSNEAWTMAEQAPLPRPHAVLELGGSCSPVSLLGDRFEALVASFDSLSCSEVWGEQDPCPDAGSVCDVSLLRELLDSNAWTPHTDLGMPCSPVG